MSHRVSHSLLDPLLVPLVPKLYDLIPIPRRFPPEGIVLLGHLLAIAGAVGFAFSTRAWWGGALVAVGVLGNHLADMLDGTHARRTGQCRNGGELLDHFTDPLSFSYWFIGFGVSCGRLELAIAGVVIVYATAVLTNIRAKLLGEFTLARWGPTEFKALLALYGIAACAMTFLLEPDGRRLVALVALGILLGAGAIQLIVGLVLGVIDVNTHGAPPDTSDWVVTGDADAPDAPGDVDPEDAEVA
jgi:archaetidylinositol phosphate synthase